MELESTMADDGSVESLLELAEDQLEQGRRWGAYASLMGAYGDEPGNQAIVTRICNLLAEIESAESATWFVLRDAEIQWDLKRPDDVETPEELFSGMLLSDSGGLFSWEEGRDRNEFVIEKVWNICQQAADHLAHLHERFADQNAQKQRSPTLFRCGRSTCAVRECGSAFNFGHASAWRRSRAILGRYDSGKDRPQRGRCRAGAGRGTL
jgi:hypothetical protein